jgi:predicted nucleic acid-binding protein
MTVVSNTTPLIKLAKINQLDLLLKVFGSINIPSAVYYEITNFKAPGQQEVKTFDWIIHQNISDQKLSTALQKEIDKGEAEAIILALELKADLLIIDEKKGRAVASDYGIDKIGTIGLLQVAKNRQIIKEIKPYLDELIQKGGFWVDQKLYKDVLLNNKEKP